MQVKFKFEPLLGIKEDQEAFQQAMQKQEWAKCICGKRWSVFTIDQRVEDISKYIADLFPTITFIGYCEYKSEADRLNIYTISFRIIFNSNDCRAWNIDSDDWDLAINTHCIQPECKNTNWISREFIEEDADSK